MEEFIRQLLAERDSRDDDEWLRNRLAQLDEGRRKRLEPLLSELVDELDGGGDVSGSDPSAGTAYDADWAPGFDGWSGQSRPEQQHRDDGFLRRFRWSYRGTRETWEVEIPGPLFEYYTERHRSRNFGVYIGDPFDDQFISDLADRFRAFGDRLGLGRREQIDAAVRFVQSLEYTPDDVTTGQVEYPKYPLETLVHDGGDCEDTSILLGAILRQLGCDVALLVFRSRGHMMLGVAPDVAVRGSYFEHDGVRYYTVEPTGHGWNLGQIPPEYRNAAATVYPAGDDSILVHQWQATPRDDGRVSVSATVANFGDAPATEVKAFVEFEDSDRTAIRRERLLTAESLDESRSRDGRATVTLPDDRRLRGRFVLTIGDTLHDTSTSEWH